MRRVRATLLAAFLLLAAWRGQAAASCPRTPDATAALALLEQARAGLLAIVIAREANPATLKHLVFERTMDGVVSLLEGIWRGDGWSAHLGDVTALMIVFGVCVAVSSKVFRWE